MPIATIISVLNFLSGAVSFMISYFAYKNNRVIGNVLLKYISIGLLLLGVGLILQAVTESVLGTTAVEALKVRGVDLTAFLVYTALQLIAYAVIARGYGLSAYRSPQGVAASMPSFLLASATVTRRLLEYIVLVLAVYIASQAGIVILLLIIVLQGVSVFSHTRSNLALMVLFGFALIFIGHLLMLGAALALASGVFLVGNTIEFCGFVSLLFFLIWSGRVGKRET